MSLGSQGLPGLCLLAMSWSISCPDPHAWQVAMRGRPCPPSHTGFRDTAPSPGCGICADGGAASVGAAWTWVPAWLFALPLRCQQLHSEWAGGQHQESPQHMHISPQLLLMERKLQEVHPLLTLCGQIVENWQGNPIQKESLRVFFLVLQVTHYLDAGQVCTASHVMATGEQAGGEWASD